MWVVNNFRSLFAAIDSVVYALIAIIYEILLQISKVNMFESGAFEDVAGKIYTLLGIFMLFKVTFSFITYLVNPDQMTDKSKGAQKIVLNILLVLAMIIITPTAFRKLYDVQTAILKDNVVQKLILGMYDGAGSSREYKMSDLCPNTTVAETDGDFFSIVVFRPFYQINNQADEDVLKVYCQEGQEVSVSKYLNLVAEGTNSTGDKVVSAIINAIGGVGAGNIAGNLYLKGQKQYVIDYKFFVSTIVGIVVLLVLVSFCFDVAVRSIKLGFLQIIAPIPIISYVDPKSGKDGMFKKWTKEVGKTWADLFIRLIALFFAVYIIQLMNIGSIFNDVDNKYKFWVQLFVVLGALIFAKRLPKLIEEILGIKLGGDLTLNPMKKIRDNALGGKAVTGALKGTAALGAGALLGAGANAAALISNSKKDGLKKAVMGNSTGVRGGLRAVGTVLGVGAGGISAGLHSAYGTYKNDSFKKGIIPGLKKSVDNRDKRDKEQDVGYTLNTKMMDKLKGMAGIKTEAKIRSEQAQSQVARLQSAQQSISFQQQQYMNQLNSENINKLSNITVEQTEDANGNKIDIYSLTDELGKKIKIGDADSWNEEDFKQLISDSDRKIIGEITGDIDDVMKYAKLQANKNALDKQIFSAMKTQKTFAEKAAEVTKS